MKKVYTLCLLMLFSLIADAQIVGNWTILGPIAFPIDDVGQINGIGRISHFKFHPTLNNKMYAISAWGGLFISTNSGTTWSKTGTDKYYFGHTASVAVDYTNDNVLYLGSGDANYYNDGTGVWKSTDAGATWTQRNTGMGNRLVLEILILPTNINTILAATNNGIYRSTDAGTNWTLVTTAGIKFQDMVFKAGSNGSVVYATAQQAYYRSTNGGLTWTQITSPAFVFGANGTRVAVTPANNNVVYIGNVGNNGTVSGTGEIYKSTDGGTTFASMRTEAVKTLCSYGTTGGGGQGNYNFDICADPTNENIVWLCSHIVWKSTDAGATWNNTQASWATKLHTDQHKIEVNPYNTTQVFNANDGGVWVSTDGTNWTTKSDGLSTSECYHASTSPIRKDMVSIATQDNGELYYAAGFWHCNGGGDFSRRSAFTYNTAQNNRVYYIDAAPNGNNRLLPTSGKVTSNYPFTSVNTRFSFSNLNINRAYVSEADVYVSNNILNNPPAWTQVTFAGIQIFDVQPSPANSNTVFAMRSDNNLVRIDNAFATPTVTVLPFPGTTSTIGLVAPTKSNPNVIYATGGQKVYRSANNGVTWTDVTANLPATNIKHIIHDIYSSDESMYLNMGFSVWYKNNTMVNWVNFSKNLPVITKINELMIFNDGTSNSVLRAAYFGRGVWETQLYLYALPVDLLSFYAERQNGNSQVTWITASEQEIKSFDLQRSTDGIHWTTITSVPPKGGTTTTHYDYSDTDPLLVTTYYRLITKDLDGKESFSKIITVSPEDKTDIVFYPNPAIDEINIHMKNIEGDVKVEIYNYKGQLLYDKSYTSADILVNTTDFISGYYILKVTTGSFSKTSGFYIIK